MAMSNYLENKLIDHLFRGVSFSAPTTLYIALLTTAAVDSDTGTTISSGGGTGVEVSSSGTNYSRVQLNPSTTNWANTQQSGTGVSSGSGGTTSNSVVVTFPTATGSWGTVTGIAIVDASTNGNIHFYGTLGTNKTVGTDDILQFTANQISVALS